MGYAQRIKAIIINCDNIPCGWQGEITDNIVCDDDGLDKQDVLYCPKCGGEIRMIRD